MNERFARAGALARVELGHEPDFTLGAIEVRPSRREIAGDGWQETVEPRVMQVLVALARAKGEILTRDDLIESCWDGVIVGEDAINRCIGRLRKVAEASGNSFSIETVPRVGYRLKIANVAAPNPDANGSASRGADSIAADRPMPPATAPTLSPVWARRSVAAVAAGMLVLIVTGSGIWWFWPRPVVAPVEPATSVAVLPFANMSGDPAKDYFSDGFSEELLNDLSNDSRLRVAARTSAFAFKGKNEDVEAIARALRVRTVVEGSVREAGDRVRIAAQLINGSDGYNIWSATYDRDPRDILKVQDEIARAIAVALTHRLVPVRLAVHRRIDPAIYKEYLQAVHLRKQFTRQTFERATTLLEHVTTAQPDFAEGLVEFAENRLRAMDYDPAHTDAYYAQASEAVEKALSLDPQNINARKVHGILQLAVENFAGATATFRSLARRDPDDIRVLGGLSVYYKEMGFPNEAIAVLERVRALDPLSDSAALVMLDHLDRADRYAEEIETARALLVHRPKHDWVLGALCRAYAETGRIGEAREFQRRLRAASNDSGECDFDLDLATGDIPAARNILQTMEAEVPDRNHVALPIAEGYVAVHDFDKASDWFERDYEYRDDLLYSEAYWVDGAEYRKTARWKALTQRTRFKEWQAEHDRVAAELKANGGHL